MKNQVKNEALKPLTDTELEQVCGGRFQLHNTLSDGNHINKAEDDNAFDGAYHSATGDHYNG